MSESEEFLAHYGVPGMKWGKHNKSKEPARVLNPSKDHSEAQGLKKKHVSEMNNDELRKLTARMQLEKQYKDLTPSTVNKGKKQVDAILSSADKANKIVKFIDSPAAKLIGKGIMAAVAVAGAAAAGGAAGAAAKTAAPMVRQLAIGR
jgi:hypothetical protein